MSTDWSLLSRLLDESLALPAAQRATWLAALEGEAATLRPRLQALLQRGADAAAQGFLERPPDFTLPGSGDEAESLHAAGEEIGPWRLTSLLGQGGMAEVWLAERIDGSVVRGIALKLPRPGFATGRMAARFARERELLARLTHPGIARLYDAGTTDAGQPWLAMEAIDGIPLVAWCEERQANLSKRIDLILQVCDALQHAHGRLVVHRDIKPSNILVTAAGEVRLLDFGIAKLLQPASGEPRTSLTHISGRPMTPEYASPEQIRGEEPGIAADVYAVGVLAYRLLAGVGPYEPSQPTAAALEAAILDQEVRRPSARITHRQLRRRLRGDLDAIVLRTLSKRPENRYPTVDALATDLRRFLSGLPVLARPDSWPYVASRYLRRHRWAVAGVAAVAASLLAGTAVAVHQAVEARGEAARSEAMYEFMHGLFNPKDTATPDAAHRDMTVRELVVNAAKSLPTALPNAPRQRLRLMKDMAALLPLLGAPEASSALIDANVAQSEQLYGKTSVEHASALLELATVKLFPAGDLAGAHAAADEALRIFQSHGIDDSRMLSSAYLMAGFYGTQIHRPPQAVDLVRIEVAVQMRRAPALRADLGNALRLLATAYGEALLEEKAAAVSLEALAASRAENGERSTSTVMALWEAADWARVTLHRAKADSLMREAKGLQAQLWDADNPWNAMWSKRFSDINIYGIHRAEALSELAASYKIISASQWEGSGFVRGLVEESLMNFGARAGRVGEAKRWCDLFERDGKRRGTSSAYNVAVRCATIANLIGDERRTTQLLEEARAAVLSLAPQQPDSYPGPALVAGEVFLVQARLTEAAQQFRHVLSTAAANDINPIANAWLGLAMASPSDARLLDRKGLPLALANLRKLDLEFFVEQEALMVEAWGRAKMAAGDMDGAVVDLARAVALREKIDDLPGGVWLARALLPLAQAQHASGDAAAGNRSGERAEAILRRQSLLSVNVVALLRGSSKVP